MFKGTSENVAAATSLKALSSGIDSTLRPYTTLVGHNLGNAGLIVSLPMSQFYAMSAVANAAGLAEAGLQEQLVAQRKLDPKHAFKLAVYMLRGLVEALHKSLTEEGKLIPNELERIRSEMGKQPYFALQPIVVNVRTCGAEGQGLRFEQLGPSYVKVYLSDRDTLWVIDGQHRRYGMDLMFEFLDIVGKNQAYPKRGFTALYRPATDVSEIGNAELAIWKQVLELARGQCTVLLDVHLGLTPEQERQLFHDLNNLGKKVEASLAFQFDESNAINLFIKEQVVDKYIRVTEKDKPDWKDDDGAIARKDLIAINARLLLNKTTVSGAKPQDVNDKIEVAKEFWEAVSNIPNFGEAGAKQNTVAAQPVVLKALAKLAYDFAFGREPNRDHLERVFEGMAEVDFSHSNPMWRYYKMTADERVRHRLTGLGDFLPSEDTGANRDIGGWDEKEEIMRFGAKHNDIFPILADMIRWRLNLPSRHQKGATNPEPVGV
ncbi:MAG TPA: DNA sulfur modification protein DndB [Tepidisphaeraceae bacterium]|nr:DNA sulfur modification protein DndB [Tepidisphaeraceae bacterium]